MFRDVRRTAGPETYHTPEDTDCRVTANVGDLMAAAMAAAGAFALVMGGATACETDYQKRKTYGLSGCKYAIIQTSAGLQAQCSVHVARSKGSKKALAKRQRRADGRFA